MDNLNAAELPPSELRLQVRKEGLPSFRARYGYDPPFRIFTDSSFFHHFDQRGIDMRQSLTDFFGEGAFIWSSSCLSRIVRTSSSEEASNRAIRILHTEKGCEIEHGHDMFACLEAIMLQEDEEDDMLNHSGNATLFFLASQNQEFWKKTDESVCTIPIIYRDGTEIIVREPERFHSSPEKELEERPTCNGFHVEGQGPGPWILWSGSTLQIEATDLMHNVEAKEVITMDLDGQYADKGNKYEEDNQAMEMKLDFMAEGQQKYDHSILKVISHCTVL